MRHRGRESANDKIFEGRLVQGVSRPSRIENIVHVTLVCEPPAQKQRCLLRLVPVGKVHTTVLRRKDLITLKVHLEVLHQNVQIVSADVEPVILVIVVVIHVALQDQDKSVSVEYRQTHGEQTGQTWPWRQQKRAVMTGSIRALRSLTQIDRTF